MFLETRFAKSQNLSIGDFSIYWLKNEANLLSKTSQCRWDSPDVLQLIMRLRWLCWSRYELFCCYRNVSSACFLMFLILGWYLLSFLFLLGSAWWRPVTLATRSVREPASCIFQSKLTECVFVPVPIHWTRN